jgi:hypothetical protein
VIKDWAPKDPVEMIETGKKLKTKGSKKNLLENDEKS